MTCEVAVSAVTKAVSKGQSTVPKDRDELIRAGVRIFGPNASVEQDLWARGED